jgi:hypothetical protein
VVAGGAGRSSPSSPRFFGCFGENAVLALSVKHPPAEVLLELIASLCGRRQIVLSSREVCSFFVDLVLEFEECESSGRRVIHAIHKQELTFFAVKTNTFSRSWAEGSELSAIHCRESGSVVLEAEDVYCRDIFRGLRKRMPGHTQKSGFCNIARQSEESPVWVND